MGLETGGETLTKSHVENIVFHLRRIQWLVPGRIAQSFHRAEMTAVGGRRLECGSIKKSPAIEFSYEQSDRAEGITIETLGTVNGSMGSRSSFFWPLPSTLSRQ